MIKLKRPNSSRQVNQSLLKMNLKTETVGNFQMVCCFYGKCDFCRINFYCKKITVLLMYFDLLSKNLIQNILVESSLNGSVWFLSSDIFLQVTLALLHVYLTWSSCSTSLSGKCFGWSTSSIMHHGICSGNSVMTTVIWRSSPDKPIVRARNT